MNPLVSIIIPCFNGERLIAEAIDSALDQTYPRKEIIVIDDGSLDGSLNVIKSYGDRIRWETGPNRGACVARNRGLALASGEFIQFLDADDLLHSDKLSVQLVYSLQAFPNVVFCKWTSSTIDGACGQLHCSNFSHPDSVVLALERVISTSAPIYPVDLFRGFGGWREGLASAQDFELNLRFACNEVEFTEIPDVLLSLRRCQGSVSSDMLRVLINMQQICVQAYENLKSRANLTDCRRAAFAARLARLGRAFLIHGDTNAAMSSFQLAREVHPSGGIPQAYSRSARVLRRIFGPMRTEQIVQFKRSLGMPQESL